MAGDGEAAGVKGGGTVVDGDGGDGGAVDGEDDVAGGVAGRWPGVEVVVWTVAVKVTSSP